MSASALRRLLCMTWTTLAVGGVGLAVLATAIVVASVRFRRCGPSSLDAADAACRLGAQLLAGAYGLLSVSLVLGAASLSLLWHLRRRRRR